MKTSRHIVTFFSFCLFFSCSAEKSFFKQSEEENTIEAYQNYLTRYQSGKYSDKANQRIREIKFSQTRDSAFTKLITSLNHGSYETEGEISVYPGNQFLMGTPFTIKIINLPVQKRITLHACRRRWNGLVYSFAIFQSDENGQIILKKHKPLAGSYSGIDPLGIFWSMTWPAQKNIKLPFEVKDLNENCIFMYAESDKKIIAQTKIELFKQSPGIMTVEINNDTLVGILHYPKNKTKLPAVILVSGSEGGYDNIDKMARIISSHGYAVLALAYFKIGPLPEFLEKIPLEYFYGAVDWLKTQSSIDTNKIVIAGGSRGGELALLVASNRKDIKGVIAVEPSCVRWQGLPHSPGSVFFPKPAWTLNGKALPYLDHNLDLGTLMKFGTGENQIELMKLYEGILDDSENVESALINVEQINGPILLIAGKDGLVWPAYRMCRMIENRLDSLNFTYPVECLYYENAGHYVTVTPDLSPTIEYKYDQIKVGGTDSGNAAAQLDSWNKMIKFLKANFSRSF